MKTIALALAAGLAAAVQGQEAADPYPTDVREVLRQQDEMEREARDRRRAAVDSRMRVGMGTGRPYGYKALSAEQEKSLAAPVPFRLAGTNAAGRAALVEMARRAIRLAEDGRIVAAQRPARVEGYSSDALEMAAVQPQPGGTIPTAEQVAALIARGAAVLAVAPAAHTCPTCRGMRRVRDDQGRAGALACPKCGGAGTVTETMAVRLLP